MAALQSGGSRRVIFGLLILTLLVALFTGCRPQPDEAAGQPAGQLTGTIRVSGAWALYPLMVKWGEEFQKLHPEVRVEISAGGAGKGMTDALSAMVDLGMVSREVKPEEVAKGAVFVPVTKDTVLPMISADNPVWGKGLAQAGVKRQTFVALWIEGKTLSWGDVAGVDANDAVQVYTRSDACGAGETWAKYLGGVQEDLQGTAVYGDPGLAEAVKQDALGIGYNNLNYAFDATTGEPVAGLRVVPIDVNENGKVDAEEDVSTKTKAIASIIAGVYPAPPSRDLYLVTKQSFSGLTQEFVHWILTDGQQYVGEAGYIQLPAEQIKAALSQVLE